MQRTRQEILSILRNKGEQTVRELAAALGLTQMSVRLHLAVLQRDGLLAAREVHQPVGRPFLVYRLTDEADDLFPKAYWLLAERLLDVTEARGGAGAVDALFEGVVEEMERRYEGRLAGKSVEERIEALVSILTEEGFMAEAEPSDDGYLVRACNCPYARVARSHPGLCAAECAFICRALGVESGDVSCERANFRLAGDLHCTYRVRLLDPSETTRAAS